MSRSREPCDDARGDTVWTVAADGLAVPAGLLTAVYLARQLGPAGYGLFALAASLVATVEWLVASALSRATIRLVAERADWAPAARTALRAHAVLGLAAGAVVALAARPLAALLGEPRLSALIVLAALELPLFGLFAGRRTVLAGLGRFKARAAATAARWVARLALVVALVEAGLSVPGALVGSAGAVLVGWLACRRIVPAGERAGLPMRAFWVEAVPLFLIALNLRLFERIGLFALTAIGGDAREAGLYAAAGNFAIGFGLLAQSATPVMLARVSRAAATRDDSALARLATGAWRTACRGLPAAALVAGSSGAILALVYGPGYEEASTATALFAATGVFTVLVTVTTTALVGARRVDLALAATGPLLPLAIAGYALAVPPMGATGAALVTAACALVAVVSTAAVLARVVPPVRPWASAWRSVVVACLVYAAAVAWPASGTALLVKAVVLGAGALVALWFTGEFSGRPAGRPIRGQRDADRRGGGREDRRGWDAAIGGMAAGGRDYLDEFAADLKRHAHLDLVARWAPPPLSGWVLKTDLFEEAAGRDAWFDRVGAPGARRLGIDLSDAVTRLASVRLAAGGASVVAADVRQLPIRDGRLSIVVSPSTLDHFATADEIDLALAELARVLKPGGVLIVTLDNPQNVTDPLLRMASWLGLTPYPIGATYNGRQLRAAIERVGLAVTDERTIIQHPRLLSAAVVGLSRLTGWGWLPRTGHGLLRWFGRFEGTRWQHRTGCFVAARAVKTTRPGEPLEGLPGQS